MMQFIKLMCFLQLVPIASCEFPAPVNVTLSSHNFQHVLRWEPGPGSPERVQYRVQYNSVEWVLMTSCLNVTITRECDLTVVFDDVYEHYAAQVQAFNETHHSNWTSMSSTFQPFSDTILGPPEVSVSGCGDCLSLQIKPPRGKGKKPLLALYYQFDYSIEVQDMKDGHKFSEILEKCKGTVNHSIKLLESGREYCVKVRMYHTGMNMNSEPSLPHCAFTSPEPVSKVPGVLVSLFIFCLLMALVVSSLVYSGFLCPLKANLPQVLASFTVLGANSKRVFVPESCTVVEHGCFSLMYSSIKKRSSWKHLDSSESEYSDSGEIDGYENHAIRVPGQESSSNEPVETEETITSVEPGQTLDPGDPAQALHLVVCEDTAGPSVEQPDPEQLKPLLERRDSEEESCQNVNLFSVMLGATDEEILESPSVEVALVVENQPPGCCNLQEYPQESPLMVALESVQIKDKEQLSYCTESESEEESDCEPSGYMRRSVQ